MKTKYVFTALFLMLSVMFFSQAKATCWNDAGAKYGINPLLLMAIGWQESRGNPNAVGPPLKDGNVALGLMQINTIHLPNLRKQGISRRDLFNPCISVHVGAQVLRDCINKFGEIWRSVGCYYGGPNSKAFTAMANYANDVQRHYSRYVGMYRGIPQAQPIIHPVAAQVVQQQNFQPIIVGVTRYEPQIVQTSQADADDLKFIMLGD